MTNISISKSQARKIWMQSQGLNQEKPFGTGYKATLKAIQHLGYLQIDTINVIERCHHHILHTRIHDYKRSHLHKAQSKDKSVFEYWTHALSYIPTEDFKYFINDMQAWKKEPSRWYSSVTASDIKNIVSNINKQGSITIRDVSDEVLVDKTHPWGSKKPTKGVLQTAFHSGELVISERQGMLKRYEITNRHFDWNQKPKAASALEVINYKVDRALRSQGIISIDSVGHLEKAATKKSFQKNIEERCKKGLLIPVKIEGLESTQFWIAPEVVDENPLVDDERTHILSPFDPLVIQRKRLHQLFDYEHKFEAYIPKDKRIYGYFALPVLIGDQIVAVIDLKADRENNELLIQKWTWLEKYKSKRNSSLIETALERFEKFQFEKN